MRFLADENFPGDVVQALRQEGHDVFWVRTETPGIPDPEVLELAQQGSRVLMTFDKDFGELAFRRRLPASCGIILFRITLVPLSQATQLVVKAIANRNDWAGHFSVIEDDRIRMRPITQA